jgi:hypothetical protein
LPVAPKAISIPDVISKAEIVSIPELPPDISLGEPVCTQLISSIRESKGTINLIGLSDRCSGVWP